MKFGHFLLTLVKSVTPFLLVAVVLLAIGMTYNKPEAAVAGDVFGQYHPFTPGWNVGSPRVGAFKHWPTGRCYVIAAYSTGLGIIETDKEVCVSPRAEGPPQ